MNARSQENLKELFEKFLDAEQAGKAAEDIRKAEQILRGQPAPEPDKQLIADIKSRVAEALAVRRQATVIRKKVYRTAAVAAAIVLLVLVSTRLLEQGDGQSAGAYASLIPTTIWESDDISADDADLVILTAEIEQIEDEVLGLQLGRKGGNGDRAFNELEMELIEETDSGFWQG